MVITQAIFVAYGHDNELQASKMNRMNNHLPDGFVYLKSIVPNIVQDMRYATKDNFTGKIVAGYENNVAILTKEAAHALKRVQEELEAQGLGLLVWDAYRPTRAVDSFMAWGKTPDDADIKVKYYPEFNKSEIFEQGFVAPGNSTHSRGSTVDLTIINIKTGKPLEMGTDFDFFGEKSNTDYTDLPQDILNNRKLLKETMEKYGFVNLPQEWWHYTLKDEPYNNKYFDFVIK